MLPDPTDDAVQLLRVSVSVSADYGRRVLFSGALIEDGRDSLVDSRFLVFLRLVAPFERGADRSFDSDQFRARAAAAATAAGGKGRCRQSGADSGRRVQRRVFGLLQIREFLRRRRR